MTESAFLFLHALTALHPGSGTALGVVDLPVQRERHTGWPTIPGSSLKGVLRDAVTRRESREGHVQAVFGPPVGRAHDHAGALGCTDARVLAFPVRSLRGVFAWVTCPAVLTRLLRDASLLGGAKAPPAVPAVALGEAACAADSALLLDGSGLVLEEFEFSRKADAAAIAGWIADHATADPATQARIRSHLAVLSDDDFTHFVRHGTEITARIALDRETKTVADGALFYEEFLPAETLLYALVIADASRRRDLPLGAREVLDLVRGHLPPVLQIGAGETIGKGYCAARLATA